MIWLSASFAAPGFPNLTDDEVRNAALLVSDGESIEGELTKVRVTLSLRDQQPELSIHNEADTPILIDWNASFIAPPNAERTPLGFGIGRELQDESSSTIPPQSHLTVSPIPKIWVEDGPDNDDDQWRSWTETSFITLELAVNQGRRQSVHTSQWRTEFDQDSLMQLELARAAEKAAKDVQPVVVDESLLERQDDWDHAHKNLRTQGRIARPIWITTGSIGGATALLSLSSAAEIPSAPEESRGPEDLTKDDYRAAATFFGTVSAAALIVAIPSFIWDRSARKKLKKLGPRPESP